MDRSFQVGVNARSVTATPVGGVADRDGDDDAVGGLSRAAARRVVRQLVAHAPHDPQVADLRDRLHDVRVVPDDQIDRARHGRQRVRHHLLRLDDLVAVLVAPVQRDDDELRAGVAGGLRVGQDQRGVDLVDEPLLAGRPHEAVEPVGVGQLGDGDPVDVVARGLAVLLGRPCRPGVGQTGPVERVERRHHPLLPEVERVVRRHRAAVVAGLRQVRRQLRRRPEPWIARQARPRAGRG